MDSLLLHAQDLAQQSCAPFLSIPKRIAYVVSHGQSYASNGYAVRTQGIAQALNEHGFETLCFVRPGRPWNLSKASPIQVEPEVKVKGVRYIHTRQTAASSDEVAELESDVQRYVELFKIYRPEVVIAASNYKVGLPAWVAAQRLGLPFYNEVRGFWELSKDAREPGYAKTTAFKKEQERDTFVAQRAVQVFTLNQPMKDELVRRGVETNKIQLVPNGVSELPEIKPADPELKRRLGINAEDKVIGYVGSFNAYEGLDLLVEACASLVEQGEPIKLLLVGDDQPIDGIKNKKIANDKKPWMIQVGRVPNERVADYYPLIDIVVIPRKKQFVCEIVPPMKLVEALAYGKPIVVSDLPPLSDYAGKYDSTLTFKVDDFTSLKTNLLSGLRLCPRTISLQLLLTDYIKPMLESFQDQGNESGATIKLEADTISPIDNSEIHKEKGKGVTKYIFPVKGQRLVIEFEVVSSVPYAHDKVIAGIELQGVDGRWVESESYRLCKYRESKQYGKYKYLSASSDGVKYVLTLDVPIEACRCIFRLGFRHGAKVSLTREPSVSFYSGGLEDRFEKAFLHATYTSMGEIKKILNSLRFNVSHVTTVLRALEQIGNAIFFADMYWFLWRLTKDPAKFEVAKQSLVFQGRMYDLKKLLNEWDASFNFKNGKKSARRIEDEIQLLESGMPMPDKLPVSTYKPTNHILYLLHNRLPYNSGGYATRTHGLLTGIEKNSNFSMHGVSRPGYPSDHEKHISKPLPLVIPRVDIIDGIEYFALNQEIRRSSLTMTEYVEIYAKEVELLAIEKKASIIHAAANFPNGLAASLAARRLGVKSVYEVRGLWEITRLSRQEDWDKTDQFQFMAKMEAEACNAADAVITITEALKDLMVSRGVAASKITVVPNCVHTDLFSPLEKDLELAHELGISEEDIVIGYIGSIVNYEGLDDLLEALALIVHDGIINFKFLLVGDGAVLAELKQQVINLNLQNHVIITGRIPHELVQRYYSLVDITPFPRKPYLVCEAVSPLKPFEAMASQKSVIVSSCAALIEIIKNGENGLVFEKGNVFALKDAIKKLILDKNLRVNLAINGRNWVIRERDWKNSASIVSDLYKDLVGVRDD